MKKLILPLLAAVAVSCGNESRDGYIVCSESNSEPITSSVVCELGEEVRYQGNISEIEFIDDSHFVAMSLMDPTVYLYNMQGEQLRVIGAVGRARGEYIFPSSATSYDGNIYLSCAQSKKIIAYDINGKYLYEESDFAARCRDIAITKDYIYRCDTSNSYVEVTRRSDHSVVGFIGEYGEVDKVLSDWNWTRVMCDYKDGVLYVDPVTLSVYSVVGDSQELLFTLSASKYKVDANVDYDNLRNDSPEYKKMDEYIKRTSTVSYVGASGNMLYIVVTQNGFSDYALITVDVSKQKASYRPIENRREERILVNNYQLVNGELYVFLYDMENDIRYVSKLNL